MEDALSSQKDAMKTSPEISLQEETSGKEHSTLKYSLLGPSLTKPGQDNVDQAKVWSNKVHGAICLISVTLGSRNYL